LDAGVRLSQGVSCHWNESVLEAGLGSARRKSEILFHLAANQIFRSSKRQAFVRASQAFHAVRRIPTGAGPHVYCCFFLYYAFAVLERVQSQNVPLDDCQKPSITELLAWNNPGVESSGSHNDLVLQCALDRAPIPINLYLQAGSIVREVAQIGMPSTRFQFPKDYIYR
jgi:hypothetical protein